MQPKLKVGDYAVVVMTEYARLEFVGYRVEVLAVSQYLTPDQMEEAGVTQWRGPAGHVYNCKYMDNPRFGRCAYHELELVKLCS